MTELKIMGHKVVIHNTDDGVRIDLSHIPSSLLWWKPIVIDYLEKEGFMSQNT